MNRPALSPIIYLLVGCDTVDGSYPSAEVAIHNGAQLAVAQSYVVEVPANLLNVGVAFECHPAAAHPAALRLRLGQRHSQKPFIPKQSISALSLALYIRTEVGSTLFWEDLYDMDILQGNQMINWIR